LPKQPRHWTSNEKTKVREMFIGGHSWAEISAEVSCATKTLHWLRQKGLFGHLPDRQGQRGNGCKTDTTDDENSEKLFGCQKQDWEQRLLEITCSWSDDERARRRVGELPGREKQFGLRSEHHKDRGNDDWKIRQIP
jgi:hypothetical protein